MEQKVLAENSPEAQTKIEYAELVKRITGQIHAATNLDHILLDLHKGVLSLFDSEEVVVFALDPGRPGAADGERHQRHRPGRYP